MPAKSPAQQRLMGMVHAFKKGELTHPSAEVEKVAEGISDKSAKDFASTKRSEMKYHGKGRNAHA